MKFPIKINKDTYPLFLILWLALVLTFSVTRASGGLDTDSCNYAVVAKEVLRSHHWLGLYDPVIQSTFYYHFPLCIWVTAFFFKLFGVTSFVAKLFSMLSNLLLITTVFYFGKLLKNHWVGFFAALSLVFTNHILRLSMQCRMDIPVTLFITLAIFSFALAQKYSRKFYLLSGLFSCLAIFSKDICGIFPLVIIFLYLIFCGKWKEIFQPLFIAGLLLALGPVIFWIWLDKQALFWPWWHYNFLHLLGARTFNVPWYYYIGVILTKYFYLLPFAFYGGYLAVNEARKKKNKEFLILIIWALIFPLVFSFGRQKLHYFILPMYPATALLVGLACDNIFKETAKPKIVETFKYLIFIPTLFLLCFPLNLRSKHFPETVVLAPVIDQALKQFSDYDFIVFRQDTAALLFYSQQLTRVKKIEDKKLLEEELAKPISKARFCYLSEKDFQQISPSLKDNFRIFLKCNDKIILADSKENMVVGLPK